MSRTLFRLEIPQAVRDENLTGRQLTERGFAVNKYAAASTTPAVLVDNAQAFVDALNAQSADSATIDAGDRVIRVHNETRALPEGNFTFIGWKFEIGAAGGNTGSLHIAPGDANRNLYFVNCNVEVVNLDDLGSINVFSIGYGNAGIAASRADDQFAATEAASRGVNSYGCLWVYNRGVDNTGIRFADFIDSEIIWQGAAAQVDSSNGGRHIRSTFNKYEGNAAFIRAYGATEVQGSIYNNFLFIHGNDGPNQPSQLVVNQPAFLPTGNATAQNTFFAVNVPQSVANDINGRIPGATIDVESLPIQLIGGPSLGNAATEALGTTRDLDTGPGTRIGTRDGIVQMDSVVRGYSGIYQYYGVADRYFSDAALTGGASGVRVRLNATLNSSTLTIGGEPSLGGRSFSAIGADFIDGNTSQVGQTNADGRLATHTWFNNNVETTGHINFFEWRDETGTGGTVWATNVDQTFAPEGMMLIPTGRAYVTSTATGTAATDADLNLDIITVTEERRAFAWDVNQEATTIARPAVREELQIPSNNIVSTTLIGNRVKAAYATNNLPNAALTAAFPATAQAVSLNDIDNAFRERWFNWAANHTPDEDATTPANNYSLTLDSTLTEHYGVAEVAGEAIITVRANGIDATGGDLFRARNFDIVDLNENPVANQDITAVRIRRPRLGNSITNPCFSNCTLTGRLEVVGDAPNFAGRNLFFNLVDVSGVDLVQLAHEGGAGTGTTIIRGRIFDPNIDNTGVAGIRALRETDFNSVTAAPQVGADPTTAGVVRFENPPFQLTLRPDATLEDLRARGGFWRVTDTSGNILTGQDGRSSVDIDGTTTLEDVTITFDSASQAVRAYYQPGATPGGYVANYGFLEVDPEDATGDTNYVVAPVDYTALAADTVVDRSGEVSITTLGSNSTQTINMVVTTSNNIEAVQSQEIAIVLLNDSSYIDTVIARNLGDQRILEFLQPFLVRYNGGLMDDPMSTEANPLPQIPVRPVINLFVTGTSPRGIANTTGYLTNPTTGNSEFFNTSIVQVIAPVEDIATAIADNNTLREIDNKTSWLVTDGNPGGTAGESTGGRLVGLRPKGENYNPNNDYTTRT